MLRYAREPQPSYSPWLELADIAFGLDEARKEEDEIKEAINSTSKVHRPRHASLFEESSCLGASGGPLWTVLRWTDRVLTARSWSLRWREHDQYYRDDRKDD